MYQSSQTRPWHSDAFDAEDRRSLMQQIFVIFQQRRPAVQTQWTTRLPDFVKRLEEALYKQAATRAEYLDPASLEARLQLVAKGIVNKTPATQSQGSPGGSGMTGSPGGPSKMVSQQLQLQQQHVSSPSLQQQIQQLQQQGQQSAAHKTQQAVHQHLGHYQQHLQQAGQLRAMSPNTASSNGALHKFNQPHTDQHNVMNGLGTNRYGGSANFMQPAGSPGGSLLGNHASASTSGSAHHPGGAGNVNSLGPVLGGHVGGTGAGGASATGPGSAAGQFANVNMPNYLGNGGSFPSFLNSAGGTGLHHLLPGGGLGPQDDAAATSGRGSMGQLGGGGHLMHRNSPTPHNGAGGASGGLLRGEGGMRQLGSYGGMAPSGQARASSLQPPASDLSQLPGFLPGADTEFGGSSKPGGGGWLMHSGRASSLQLQPPNLQSPGGMMSGGSGAGMLLNGVMMANGGTKGLSSFGNAPSSVTAGGLGAAPGREPPPGGMSNANMSLNGWGNSASGAGGVSNGFFAGNADLGPFPSFSQQHLIHNNSQNSNLPPFQQHANGGVSMDGACASGDVGMNGGAPSSHHSQNEWPSTSMPSLHNMGPHQTAQWYPGASESQNYMSGADGGLSAGMRPPQPFLPNTAHTHTTNSANGTSFSMPAANHHANTLSLNNGSSHSGGRMLPHGRYPGSSAMLPIGPPSSSHGHAGAPGDMILLGSTNGDFSHMSSSSAMPDAAGSLFSGGGMGGVGHTLQGSDTNNMFGSSSGGPGSAMAPGPSGMMWSGPTEGRAAASGGAGAADDFVGGSQRNDSVQKQQRWLLFLRHCAKCRHNEQECQLKSQCKFGKQLWTHILQCGNDACPYPRCSTSRELLKHHQKCSSDQCPICAPVKDYVRTTRQAAAGAVANGQHLSHPGGAPLAAGQEEGGFSGMTSRMCQNGAMQGALAGQAGTAASEGGQGQLQGGVALQSGSAANSGGSAASVQRSGQKRPHTAFSDAKASTPAAMDCSDSPGVKREPSPALAHGMASTHGGTTSAGPARPALKVDTELGAAGGPQDGDAADRCQQQVDQASQQAPTPGHDTPMAKRIKSDASIISQNTFTSLLEAFTAEQIRRHVDQIRCSSALARSAQPPPPNPNDACKVCLMTRLSFEPPVIYCSFCGLKIKRAQVYYCTAQTADSSASSFCHTCFVEQKGERIVLEGTAVRKADLTKKKNDEDQEEGWVCCDHCEGWVHMLCGLFNKGRNTDDVHYLCPDCLLLGLEAGQRPRITARPQSMLEARDLGTTRLSDYLESRLRQQLDMEQQQRAALLGKMPHEVPAVEPLTIRVVNNVMKKCEVKSRFHDMFASDGVPYDFPYRQKVVLLFQNLDGVDVCLFCMYVQEYGDTCPEPNRNTVYLSYLDSIKYFRPDMNAAGVGNASLRTMVYHQLLIGYLSYVKMLGYEKMFIWACPPMAGDDYILHCHPPKQKTPRSDRLRAWYLDMCRQAKDEGIVTHLSTLWDTYFDGGADHRKDPCSSTQIPYLEGDYWPGEAENQLATLNGATAVAPKSAKKAAGRKPGSKGKSPASGPAAADELLMSRLGEVLGGPMKEDFIVVHLQEVCTFCRDHPQGGASMFRYSLPPPGPRPLTPHERRFDGLKLEDGGSSPAQPGTQVALCEPCWQEEQRRWGVGEACRLPGSVQLGDLEPHIVQRLERLVDLDADLENEFFETRQSFLSLCQGNHFQFDSLRRAKHSSMMVLYHLHNPNAPAFATTCNVCTAEVEPGSGFRCTVCTDFDICAACKTAHGHAHPLKAHTRSVDETRTRLTQAEQHERHEQLARTMQLLVHACSCSNAQCSSNSCRKVRQLFQHAMQCSLKVTGGCSMCKKMWYLLSLHAKGCTQPDCVVPRCRELKGLRRRQTARQEEQRRKAYQTMLRQQNAAAMRAPAK